MIKVSLLYYNMWVLLLLNILLTYVCFILKNKKIKRILLGIIIVFYTLYMGLRPYDVGTDTKNYIYEYLTGTGGYFKEIAFKFIGKWSYYFKLNFNQYLLVISTLQTLILIKCCKNSFETKEERNLFYWIFLFNAGTILGYVNIIRQFLANLFLLLSLSYYFSEKKKSYLFYILSILFHSTAIFFGLIFYKKLYIKYLKLSKKIKVLIIIITGIVSTIIPNLLLWNDKFQRYFYHYKSGKSFYMKLLIVMVFYFYYIYKKENNKFLEYILFYSCLLVLVFWRFSALSNRMIYYVNSIIPFILVEIYLSKRKNSKRIMFFVIFSYHILLIFYPSIREQFGY